MFQTILNALQKAIDYIHDLTLHQNNSESALAAQMALIADMKGKLDARDTEHAALLARVTAAEAHSADLDLATTNLDAKAKELSDLLSGSPLLPSVHPDTFAVTAPPIDPLVTPQQTNIPEPTVAETHADRNLPVTADEPAIEPKPLTDPSTAEQESIIAANQDPNAPATSDKEQEAAAKAANPTSL